MTQPFTKFMVGVEVGTSRKLRRLRPEERWCFVAGVLAIAAKSPHRGVLLVADDLHADETDFAEQAGVSVPVARRTLAKLRELGLLVVDDEGERVRDWDEWQPRPRKPSDEPEATRERQRRARDKARDVTRDKGVTSRGEVEGEEKNPPVGPPPAGGSGVPKKPRGNRVRDRQRAEAELDAFVAEHFPHSIGEEGRKACRQAIASGASTPEQVIDFVGEWWPQLLDRERAAA